MAEDEALTAGRHDTDDRYREANVGGHLQIFDYGITTMSSPGIYDPSMIDVG